MYMHTRTPGSVPRKGLLALNDDIIHSILCQMPDFRTLSSVAMTCKGLYNRVFRDNPRGILRSVASNASGSTSCLEAALRAIRIQRLLPDFGKTATADIVALGAVKEDIPLEEVLKPWIFAALDDRLAVGHALEVAYSRSCKNRVTYRTSLLSSSESDLFQTALHRAWLVSSLYCHDVAQLPPDYPTWPTGTTCNQLLLSDMPAAQLAAFVTIWHWMASILHGPGRPGSWLGGRTKSAVLERGPRGALQLLEHDKYATEREKILFEHNERIHLDVLLSECDALLPGSLRAPDPRLDAAILTRGILSTIVGANECCSKCGEQAGLALWNFENASSPPRDLQRSTLFRHFGGMLRYSMPDSKILISFLERLERFEMERIRLSGEAYRPAAGVDVAMGRVIREIFEIDGAESLVKRAYVLPDKDITPQSLLCAKCLGKVLDGRLWAWWLIQTETVYQYMDSRRQDCWHGNDCRRQLHKETHRLKFNHACRPSQEYAAYRAAKKAWVAEKRAKKRAALARAAAASAFLERSLDDDFPDDLVSLAATAGKA